MTRSLNLTLITIFCGLIGYSCNDGPTEPVGEPARFEDFVHFDTTQLYLIRQFADTGYGLISSQRGEALINWEESFGEPFIDMDGDGVFTPGIDVFIICICEDNMDLNRSSSYTGPDPRLWTPGVPFDDINGDGVLNRFPGDYFQSYEPNLPFADINGNGRYDAFLPYVYNNQELRIEENIDPDYSLVTFRRNSLREEYQYTFVSDSGVTYTIDAASAPAFTSRILLGERGLYIDYGLDGKFRILDTGQVSNRIDEMIFADDDDTDSTSLTFLRTITLNQTLTILSKTYKSLLRVSLHDSNLQGTPYGLDLGAERDFYFDKELGLIAEVRPKYFDGAVKLTFMLDMRTPLDQLPLPMIR